MNQEFKVHITEPNKEQERETAYQLKQLRFNYFVAELAMLSRKYGVAIQGEIHFADFDKVAYSADLEDGKLNYSYTLKP